MSTSRLNQILQFLKDSPDDSFLLFALAKEYEKADDLNAALLTYERLRAVDEEYVGLYFHLGALLEKLERKSDALAVYDAGIEIARRVGDIHALGELRGVRMNLEME